EVVVGGYRPGAVKNHPGLQMILQVLADAGQLMHERNRVRAKQMNRTYAGELEQLRTLQCAGTEQDRFACAGGRIDAVAPEDDAAGPLAVEGDSRDMRLGFDPKVGAMASRLQVRSRGAATPAASSRQMVVAHALLPGAVEIVVARNPEFHRGGDDRFDQLVLARDDRAPERTVMAMVVGITVLGVLEVLEVRQDLGVAPPGIALGGPLIVVLRLAADGDETIDRA